MDPIIHRFIHSDRVGWLVLRYLFAAGPLLLALFFAVMIFVEAWTHR
jgi:hypothetical protein